MTEYTRIDSKTNTGIVDSIMLHNVSTKYGNIGEIGKNHLSSADSTRIPKKIYEYQQTGRQLLGRLSKIWNDQQ